MKNNSLCSFNSNIRQFVNQGGPNAVQHVSQTSVGKSGVNFSKIKHRNFSNRFEISIRAEPQCKKFGFDCLRKTKIIVQPFFKTTKKLMPSLLLYSPTLHRLQFSVPTALLTAFHWMQISIIVSGIFIYFNILQALATVTNLNGWALK